MNLDNLEVETFSALAEKWWEPNGPCAPLHVINPCRLEFIKSHAKLENKNILDVGCGAGILTESMAKYSPNVIGIDASQELINCAREHAEVMQVNVNYQACIIENFITKNPAQQFDIITCMELLEHVPEPGKLIQDCYSLLKPGGQIFFSTINRNPKAYALAIIGAEYLLNILPKHTHDYKKFIRPAELVAMCRNSNLRVIELSGIRYQPFTKAADLCSDVDVNYLAYAIKEK